MVYAVVTVKVCADADNVASDWERNAGYGERWSVGRDVVAAEDEQCTHES